MQPEQPTTVDTTDTSSQQPDAVAAVPAVDARVADDGAREPEPHFAGTISWEASESVHHHKSTIWYIGVGATGVLLLALSIVIQAWTFTALVVVMVAAIFFMSVRPPRVLHYQVSGDGLSIGETHYSYRDFRAFGVVQEDALYYITLLPMKRFMPAIDVYFPTEHGEQIVDAFGAHIPMQTITPDFIDKLMKQLRV